MTGRHVAPAGVNRVEPARAVSYVGKGKGRRRTGRSRPLYLESGSSATVRGSLDWDWWDHDVANNPP
ncbi:hypothetical protein CRG98_039315 [Punica granatum]|uniref:Uncharacterized protein n=1 Tax=Punica granatum TaxID=22663 RepID=A0A2I0I9E7_PUNGR|nr:hypothetical protein CRG98_039315 [Punica granatum]